MHFVPLARRETWANRFDCSRLLLSNKEFGQNKETLIQVKHVANLSHEGLKNLWRKIGREIFARCGYLMVISNTSNKRELFPERFHFIMTY